MKTKKLPGSVIVISGASGGVGETLVRYFLDLGAKVIGIDLINFPTEAKELDLKNYHHIIADLSVFSEVQRVRETIQDLYSKVDILVNNAAIFYDDNQIMADWARLTSIFQNNLFSVVYLSNQLNSLLLKGANPIIINIASTDGIVASAGQDCEIGVCHDTIYAASKGAVITYTKSLAQKCANEGIRVNAICPTIIRTPMAASLLVSLEKEKNLCKNIPLGRICEPLDIAVAVECLYNLTFTTAHVLTIDGGYLCQ